MTTRTHSIRLATLFAALAITLPSHAGLLGGGGALGGNIGGNIGGSLNGSLSGLQRPDLARVKDGVAAGKDKAADAKSSIAEKADEGKTQGQGLLAGTANQANQAGQTKPNTPIDATSTQPSAGKLTVGADAAGNAAADRNGASANGNASVRTSGQR